VRETRLLLLQKPTAILPIPESKKHEVIDLNDLCQNSGVVQKLAVQRSLLVTITRQCRRAVIQLHANFLTNLSVHPHKKYKVPIFHSVCFSRTFFLLFSLVF
jgi:hypothetical protein